MNRSDLERLRDAKSHAAHASALLTRDRPEALASRREPFQAFLFDLTIIGTTFARLPKGIQALSPDVPWRDAINTRNRIVHAYWQNDSTLLSAVTVDRLVHLIAALDRLIAILEREG